MTFDLITKRERNQRFASHGGAMAAAARQKKARGTARETLARAFGKPPGLFYTPEGASPSYTDPNPITVRMWRIGPGWLDSDGPDDALKACRDGVADWLGIDDRNAGVDWPRGLQEKTPPGTPWRVRIEVTDASPGPDRVVVLASEIPSTRKQNGQGRKRPKGRPDGDPGEELAACMLVACTDDRCRAPVMVPCKATSGLVYGVHLARAEAAGIRITADVFRRMGLQSDARKAAPRTGVRKMARQVALPLVRCYARLPWEQATCMACGGAGGRTLPFADFATLVGTCDTCRGTGTRGMSLRIETRVDGLSPPGSLAYMVPEQHRARWGQQVTLYRRSTSAAGLGTITVYDMKGR